MATLKRLSDELFAVLERELAQGPVAHGWPDQTWTLSRIKTLIGRRFHKSYTVQGGGRPCSSGTLELTNPRPAAIERDETAVAGWGKQTWLHVEGPAGQPSRLICRLPGRPA
ncbi:winged helix-turn-helix domain-containing protein [Streptomyces albogriseolus]|uniref:winged helix-turn-helix domain-containing protein n=1 Tax=Streptomyces albogriseolus TaxID=1887 RepID=UPI003F49F176